MSNSDNTPTEFDKEVLETLAPIGFINPALQLEMLEKIRQAVDKYVIGEDEPPYLDSRSASGVRTDLRDKQRQSLWGDKQ